MVICEPLREDMLDECARIYVGAFNAEPWHDAWEIPTARKRLADIFHTPGFFGLALTEDGHILGSAFGNVEQYYDGHMYCLREMFVDNHLRGQGYGGRFLSNLEDALRSRGVHTLHLFTALGNATEGFYRKHGYGPLKEMRMMAKELS
jgi:aminoglycoside 6'-N-acetyltransferase I